MQCFQPYLRLFSSSKNNLVNENIILNVSAKNSENTKDEWHVPASAHKCNVNKRNYWVEVEAASLNKWADLNWKIRKRKRVFHVLVIPRKWSDIKLDGYISIRCSFTQCRWDSIDGIRCWEYNWIWGNARRITLQERAPLGSILKYSWGSMGGL